MMANRRRLRSTLQGGWMQGRRMRRELVRLLAALCLLVLGTWQLPARAQSCPGGYSACDSGGCCLSSDQCCPRLADGCCNAATPYCCGDGSCAASPPECPSAVRNACTGYDIPCGNGCAPAGSQCCDLVGHYCPPQGICTSETRCVSGDQEAVAKLVLDTPADPAPGAPGGKGSPLADPSDGTARSCALAVPRGGVASSATPFAGLPLALLLAAVWLQRRRR